MPVSGEITPGWTPARSGDENCLVYVGDIELWASLKASMWQSTGEHIVVAHPQYPDQRHSLGVIRIAADPPLLFAGGEVSNSHFVFSLPVTEQRPVRVLYGR